MQLGEYYVIVTDVAYGCVDTAESVTFTDPSQWGSPQKNKQRWEGIIEKTAWITNVIDKSLSAS